MDAFRSAILDARQAVRPVLGCLQGGHLENERKRSRKELYADSHVETLYGTIADVLEVPLLDGSKVPIDYIDPAALLVEAAARSLPFFCLMQQCVAAAPGGVLRCVIYHDGVTPGNNHRPDWGRQFNSFLWSFLELPQWLRNRDKLRWFTLAYVLKRTMKEKDIGIPQLIRAVLFRLWRHHDTNFAIGVRLRHKAEHLIVRMRFACCPQDFLAHVDCFGLKGASALCPCAACNNCIGRRAYFEDDSGFCHVESPSYHKFKIRSLAQTHAIVRKLRRLAAIDPESSDLAEYEQATGICFDPQGVLFDDTVNDLVRFPEAMYFDSTHCLWSSGGVGQFHINQFVRRITTRTALTLEDLDDFAHKIRGAHKLRKPFFCERVVDDDFACLRGFASEMLTCVRTLMLFVQVVLKASEGAARIAREIECFEQLSTVAECLRRGKQADAQIALQAWQEHHDLFVELYPLCAKPKLHYTWHAILSWLWHGVLITGFGAESEHRMPKRVMHNSYNKCWQTAMAHWIRSFFNSLGDAYTFEPTHLVGVCKALEGSQFLGTWGVVRAVASARSISAPCGTFAKGDLLFWEMSGEIVYGLAHMFASVRKLDGSLEHICRVQSCDLAGDCLYRLGDLICVQMSVVQDSVPYVLVGTLVRPLRV